MAYSSYKAIEIGVHIVTAAEETAETLDITLNKSCTGFVVTILSSAGLVKADADISIDGDTLTIATNSTDFVLTEDDVINYICF
jgi:hypothetical protein